VVASTPVPPVTASSVRVLTSLEEADELEEDYLDRAWGLEPVSRLACQAKVGTEDLTVEIPKYSLNHAAEAPH